MRLFLVVLALIVAVCAPAATLSAAGPTLSIIEPPDKLLVIPGTYTNQAIKVSGSLRLHVAGGAVDSLGILASDLVLESNPTIKIDRSNVSIEAGVALKDGQTRDVLITVSNVARPGTYTGDLQLLPDRMQAGSESVKLRLEIGAKPLVSPVKPSSTFQVVRCERPGECWLVEMWMGSSVLSETRTIDFENQTLTPVAITSAQVVLRGETTGASLGADAVQMTMPLTLTASQVSPVTLALTNSLLLPDRYEGTIRISAANGDTPVVVDTVLLVRSGPYGALLAILVGLVFGWFARSQETPQAQKQIKLWPRLQILRTRAAEVNDAGAISFLNDRLAEIEHEIESPEYTDDAVTPKLATLDTQISIFLTLDRLEAAVTIGIPQAQEILGLIHGARAKVITNQLDNAKTDINSINAKLREAIAQQRFGPTDAPTLALNNLQSLLSAQLERLTAPPAASPTPPAATNPQDNTIGFERLIPWIRLIFQSAKMRFWLSKILQFALLLLLVVVGFKTTYIDNGSIFGAHGLADYLTLFLWGLSAGFAQQAIQKLTGK